ncbi:MAG: Asp23/Gls24 family envelope stress response protein [Lachnospiraceae bacterium]|nr:Asp23/Gls24 family envelope stress response protein [Lachnospiraceae bacterium]
MKGRINTELGTIAIDTDAISQYAGTEAMACFGIVGMAKISMRDGIVKMLKKDSLGRGINVFIKDNKLYVDFHVIVSYGVSIKALAENLVESVKYKLEKYTGFAVERINIFVEGVRVID